jgi:CSLREA domain-containing protein
MKKAWSILLIVVVTIPLADLVAAQPAVPSAVIFVTIQTDTVNSTDGECSLREAVIAANTNAASGSVGGECDAGSGVSADSIIVPVGTYYLTRVGPGESYAATGDLDIREPVNIYGAGKDLVIIQQETTDRIFDVPAGLGSITFRLTDVTLTGGYPHETDGGGGAVKTGSGRLEVEDVIFRGNRASDSMGAHGGAIEAASELEVLNCLFLMNTADERGGAVYISAGVTGATIKKSLFRYNMAITGGAIENNGGVTIENVTFSHNLAMVSGGGAINNNGTMTLRFSTLVGNQSRAAVGTGQAGALHNGSTANVAVHSSILAWNSATDSAYDNCNAGGTWLASDYNLEDDDTCPLGPSNTYNTDPMLGLLGDWGGPTQVHPLLYGSPAIDAAFSAGCPDQDQRSVDRPFDGNYNGAATCDIGAFEADARYHAVYLPLISR